MAPSEHNPNVPQNATAFHSRNYPAAPAGTTPNCAPRPHQPSPAVAPARPCPGALLGPYAQPLPGPDGVRTPNPAPATPVPAPPLPPPKRRSKIARLPANLREQLNLLLDEGATYREIIEWLTANGHSGFNQNNLYHWRYGGYQDWREEHERAEQAHALRQWAACIASTDGPATLTRAIANFAAARMHGLLCTLDLPRLAEQLESHPELCVRYFNSLLRTGKMALDTEKFQASPALKPQKETKIIDAEGLREIERRLNLGL